MKVGIRLMWKDPDRPVRPPRMTAVIYADAKNEHQALSAAKRMQDSYAADDYEIVG